MSQHSPRPARRILILGSTGSIGVNTLQVLDHFRSSGGPDFKVVGLAAGSNAPLLLQQAQKFSVRHVSIADPNSAASLSDIDHVYTEDDRSDIFPDGKSACTLIEQTAQPGDLVVGAMVGAAGIPAILKAIEKGCDIALANKETLVAAGELVIPLARKKKINLIPIDSEHSAIFQCLQAGRTPDEIQRIILTASGGPFRTWTTDQIRKATLSDALNHPTWTMGKKVTIDSATMMNKALEVIEAQWLFNLPPEKIETIIHPQSTIHGLVEFTDGSIIAQMGPPDMRTPIQYALTWPARSPGCSSRFNWSALHQLNLEPVDHTRFGSVKLAYRVIESGGTAGATFNAANEQAVTAFLGGRIGFRDITDLVTQSLDSLPIKPIHSMDDVLEADRTAREFIKTRISTQNAPSSPSPHKSPAPAST